MLVQCTGYDDQRRFTGNAPILLNCATRTAWPIPRVDDITQLYTDALSSAQTGTIGGFLKIELQDTNKAWRDVTMEILNYGIGGPNLDGPAICADPTPNAILRFQRLRDNGGGSGGGCNGGGCNYAGSTKTRRTGGRTCCSTRARRCSATWRPPVQT